MSKKYTMGKLSKLQTDYLKIFGSIKPILDDMGNHWKDLYPEYLGWFDLGSPIFEHPDILFVGINPGPGRFRLWNYNKPKNAYTIPVDFPTPWRSELQWTKIGVAKEGRWHDETSKQKNLFPKTMCELLVRIYRPDYPNLTREEMTSIFNDCIMCTNLFPMVTKDKKRLDMLINRYSSHNHKDITMLCRSNIMRLIDLVSPKIVVLLGKTLEPNLKPSLLQKGIHYTIVDRTRGWHSKERITEKAKEIRELLDNTKIAE